MEGKLTMTNATTLIHVLDEKRFSISFPILEVCQDLVANACYCVLFWHWVFMQCIHCCCLQIVALWPLDWLLLYIV